MSNGTNGQHCPFLVRGSLIIVNINVWNDLLKKS